MSAIVRAGWIGDLLELALSSVGVKRGQEQHLGKESDPHSPCAAAARAGTLCDPV